jgi:16S rRNA (cytidine1402-2'-O)-methyltransferase
MPLVVCATPIGNLADVTLRVLDELRQADLVLCEDTRRTRILLERHGIETRLSSYHRHNEAARTLQAIDRLRAGERIALVSDAGLPGINDPGARLIAAVVAEGLDVTVLPGPSAVETALVVSSFAVERYRFVGYLPRRPAELRELAGELAAWPDVVVAFESPGRLPRSLAALAEELPERSGAVCRELTKRFEEVTRGTLTDLATRFAGPVRGEITLVVGPAVSAVRSASAADAASARRAVVELVESGASRRRAAEVVARLTGSSRNALYRDSL